MFLQGDRVAYGPNDVTICDKTMVNLYTLHVQSNISEKKLLNLLHYTFIMLDDNNNPTRGSSFIEGKKQRW